MKKYLVSIESRAYAHIGYYADTPNKNYRIYYCGSDTGARYERIGNASRALERLAGAWQGNGSADVKKHYATKNEIPRRGSNA